MAQEEIRTDASVLDVRPTADFELLHRTGAVNIPLEELASRIHELPPPTDPLLIFDTDETRAQSAASVLGERDRTAVSTAAGMDWLASAPTASGPSRGRLWKPHRLVEEAISLFGSDEGTTPPTALDIACGTGRDAVRLALAGFDTSAWDILPDALARCDDLARRSGVKVHTACHNVETPGVFDGRQFDLIACFNFLHRPLMPSIAAAVRPGGLVVYETFVHPQRELFGKPTKDSHLLRSNELPGYFSSLEILVSREGLTGPRRMAASLIARRPLRASEPP